MRLDWDETTARMSAKGREDKYPPAHTGLETDEELRALVLQLAQNCSVGHSHRECVFRPLISLSYTTVTSLIAGLSRKACIEILEDECGCRNLHQGHNCQIPQNHGAGFA